jgi:peptidoglycan-N-acetylglucosamine deacetylase
METPPKFLYLTIDDAPSGDFENKLKVLNEAGIKAVWFCEGAKIKGHFDALVSAIQTGHVLGNHSYTHPHFSDLTFAEAEHEIQETHVLIDQLYQAAGVPRHELYFRFPYGDKGDGLRGAVYDKEKRDVAGSERHNHIQGFLHQLGYFQPDFENITYGDFLRAGLSQDIDMYWTLDTVDWHLSVGVVPNTSESEQALLTRLETLDLEHGLGLPYAGSSEIVICHDHEGTDSFFPKLVTMLARQGYEFRLPSLPEGVS